MSSKLEYSQVIALSPNRLQTFSATLPSLSKPVFFSFGCESLINIINRIDFSRITIPTPDDTSPVILLSFSGTKYLFCLNKNGILYVYSPNSFSSGPIYSHDIGCVPISMATSDKYIFYIYNKTLYRLSIENFINHKSSPEKLTDDGCERFNELSISPCGRALAVFTIGKKQPEIWFTPFRENQHSNLPIRSNLIDFKWGLSETLICITATEGGLIRVWEEQTDKLSLHQKSWFHFDQPILFSCFCIPIDDRHQPQYFHEAQSKNCSVFPLSKNYPLKIIVGLKNGTIRVLKGGNQPELIEIAYFDLNSAQNSNSINKNNCVNSSCINDKSFNGDDMSSDYNSRFYALADFRNDFIENQYKMLISLTLFSKKSLSFHYFEIGDSSVLTTVPYRISFISSAIKSILTNEKNHVLTQMEDNKLINWSLVKVEDVPKTDFDFVYKIKAEKIKKSVGILVKDNMVSVSLVINDKITNTTNYKLDFKPIFWKFLNLSNCQIIGFFSTNEKSIVLFVSDELNDNKYKINKYDVNVDKIININKVVFHSSDLFATASDDEIQIFIYQNGQYNYIYSLHHENNSILFLPKLLIAVASSRSISFFTLSSKGFVKLMSIKSTHINAMNYINKSLIVATKRVLFRLLLTKDMFPLPLPVDDKAVYTTLLSICHFSVIQDFINGKKPTLNSFLTHIETESFSIKPIRCKNENENENEDGNKKKSAIPIPYKKETLDLPYFSKFLDLLPQNWQNVDSYGMKFIFCMNLMNFHIQKMQSLLSTFVKNIEKKGLIEQKSILKIEPEELIKIAKNNIQKAVSFFSIWGLLSTDQSNLANILSFKSVSDICISYLPLWMKNDVVLKKTINKFLLNNIPPPDASNYDFDAFILLCTILDKKTFASKIAKRSHNNSKISSFLENIDKTSPEKIGKSAFSAYGQHRFSLAAMFFLFKGMKNQAISSLANDAQNPLLAVLVARLIGYENWQSLIKNEEFYFEWWDDKQSNHEKALNIISSFEYDSVRIDEYLHDNKEIVDENAQIINEINSINQEITLMINANKYEMLRKLKFGHYRRYLLDMQKIPFLIIYYSNYESTNNINLNEIISLSDEKNETQSNSEIFPKILNFDNKKAKTQNKKPVVEKNKVQNNFDFSFGVGLDDIDDNIDFSDSSSDSKNEEEEKKENQNEKNNIIDKYIEFKSNISDMFLSDDFESNYADPLLISEEYIITLLSELYNQRFTKQTISFLISVARNLLLLPQSLHIITMIMFSITFALSDFTWLSPMIQFNFDPLYIITAMDHYSDLLSSDNESDKNELLNKIAKNELKEKSKPTKLKEKSKINSTSHRHIVKSNSMNSFNQVSQISKIAQNALHKNHFHEIGNDYNLYRKVDSDNLSSSDEDKNDKNDTNNEDDNLPNFFSVVCPDITPTRGDKELACFITFDRMLAVLNGLLTNSNPTIFTSFLHHRHRLMYRKIKLFRFSHTEISRDLDAAGLKCQVIEKMRHTKENRIWAISLHDKFTSPFFSTAKNGNANNSSNSSYLFQYTASFDVKTTSSRVLDVCINPENNQQIALAAKQLIMINKLNPRLPRDLSYSSGEQELNPNDIESIRFTSSILEPMNSNNDESNEFQSPLLSFLSQQKFTKWNRIKDEDYLTRSLNIKWPATNSKNCKATSICSHPFKSIFVSGDASGHLNYWNFGSQIQSTNVIKFFNDDYKVHTLKFNKAGDRICCADSKGRVIVSDFVGYQSFTVESPYTSINWLNNDNQFVACCNPNNEPILPSANDSSNPNQHMNIPTGIPKISPSVDNFQSMKTPRNLYKKWNFAASTTFSSGKKTASLQIFDILVGNKPVTLFDMNKPLPSPKIKIPLDVFGPMVVSGYEDGSVEAFDVRWGNRLANLPIHNQAITAIKFDESGSFFITGGIDNKIVIVESQLSTNFQQLEDVLPNYDPKSRKRGIFNLSISKQTIVACGYSSFIHVWTKTCPTPM